MFLSLVYLLYASRFFILVIFMKKEKANRQKIRRYLDGLYSKSEVSDLLKSMQDRDMQSAFEEISDEIWEESMKYQPYVCDMEHEQYKQEAARLLKKIERRPLRKVKCMRWVAVCAVLLMVGIGVPYIQFGRSEKILYTEVSTSFGEKKEWVLPDGSVVNMNACTTLKYPEHFDGKERKIELNGEAYFQVMRNEKKPFIVRTSDFDVKVLGTSFDVKAYPDNEIAQISVESGKVEVDLSDAMMRLVADEQVQINTASNEYVKKKADHKQVMTWLQNKLHYNNTPLNDVIKDLERIYNCKIKIAPEQNINCLLSGDHDNKSLHSVLQSIEYVTGIKYKQENGCIILYH